MQMLRVTTLSFNECAREIASMPNLSTYIRDLCIDVSETTSVEMLRGHYMLQLTPNSEVTGAFQETHATGGLQLENLQGSVQSCQKFSGLLYCS